MTVTDGTTFDTVAVPSASFPAVETVHAENRCREDPQ